MSRKTKTEDFSIIALDKFIKATRDSGYKGTSSAVAELVDNAIQADANRIEIRITRTDPDDPHSMVLVVHDNGSGMDRQTLRNALRFGGSTRFNDRRGLGRYGMGLPNSSLSQARCVRVYTWQSFDDICMSYLDVDEIATGAVKRVPVPRRAKRPLEGEFDESGTIVVWSRCDQLDNRRVSTITRKLLAALGRRFRYFIWHGVRITVNGDLVEPLDPLLIHPEAKYNGAELFGEPIEYEIQADPTNGNDKTGIVRVQFAELPVEKWHKLPNQEKRRLGISKGAGVSVVRAGREVDYGWFFLSGKRRENYDDWWRCEIQFDPVLDEAFGITHTKQQIRPKAYLLEALSPDIEAAARALNGRTRKAHLAAKTAERFSASEKLASECEKLLEPLPSGARERDQAILDDMKSRHPTLRQTKKGQDASGQLEYKIIESSVRDTAFYTYAREDGRVVLALNPSHPFYKHVYKPLADSSSPQDRKLRTQLELLLLSLARAEATEEDSEAIAYLDRHRLRWSNMLATFLNG